ncbi:MAG: elongation factor G [Bacteroidota bacterium]|nr:elongation factor G [Odoribacter sp.]MDP3641864.1 elongation factor G [Bacteroidota bacterium]
MKVYKTDEVRNITLIGNAGSGKTTLAEAMLFEGGVINRRGDVGSKNTVSDYHLIEQEYGNSVFSSLMYTEVNGKKINILDTPGMDDFCGGVVSSLQVAAMGLMVVDASAGIGAGTEAANRHAEAANAKMIFVINHLDTENANFDQTIDNLKTKFGNKVTIVQYPVETGMGFNSIIDVLKMKMYKYGPDGGKPEVSEIPASEKERAEELHNELIEMAAENEESLMEMYFEQGSLSEDDMRKGMRIGMVKRDLFPVFCVSAKKNMGVGRLLEFVCNIAPAPSEVPMREIVQGKTVVMNETSPTSLFVFKTSLEPHVGEVTYFKVMSGKLTEGKDLYNTFNNGKERISQLFVTAGKTRHAVSEIVAGDIGCTVKLKDTKFNQTLCEKELDLKFAPIKFPDPKFRVAIKAVSETDDEKVGEILHRVKEEDPTYLVQYSKELRQLIVEGQGEYHLNTLKWYFDHIHKIDIEFKTPKIPYRETITKSATGDYRHKKQSGGSGQFGEVHMIIEPFEEGSQPKSMFTMNGKEQKISVRDTQENPLPWGGKLVFHNCIVGGSIDLRFLPAILKGIMEKMEEGPLTGSYARDIRVYIYDGKMHPVDSNEISFRLAGRNAFSIAFRDAGAKILEPIYDLDVWVQGDRMGDVMSDLQGRRAIIMGMGSERGYEKITARVPLKEMNKYSTSLSSLTGGRGVFNMKFAAYEKVPQEVQEELLAAYAAEEKDE